MLDYFRQTGWEGSEVLEEWASALNLAMGKDCEVNLDNLRDLISREGETWLDSRDRNGDPWDRELTDALFNLAKSF
jgi:hypothetical protein